jgi:glyoxylase-like metal-dependent hydrolase (beta-lactamase superfamily II)
VCAQTPSAHQNPEKQNEALKISHLTGDYYIFETYIPYKGVRYNCNGMYVVTTDGVALIGAPWNPDDVQPLLDSIAKRHQKKVVFAIAHHFHHDGGTGSFDVLRQHGVKTYSSKLTLELCKKHNEKQAEFTFAKDTTFTIGNHTFKTYYPGPGHSQDGIVLWFPDEQILFGGCFVKGSEATDLGYTGHANLKEWPKSVKKVIKKYPNPKYVIPGHHNWNSNQGLQHTLKLLEAHNKQAK